MTDSLHNELITVTCDLIGFATTADRPDQLAAISDYVAHAIQDIPDIYIHRSESHGKPALVVTLHNTRTPSLMLNGHLDVVAAEAEQFRPQVRDGRIYGRGSQDMKGSVAVMLRLLKDLAAQEARPDVGFQFVSDEEIGGSHGTQRLCNEGWGCDMFIALEPTDLNICHAHKGAMWLELRLPGLPAHGSRPWEGRNPIEALHAGLTRLAVYYPPLTAEAWRTTVTPTVVHAGAGSSNQLAPELLLTFDIRHVPEDRPEDLVATVLACFPDAEVIKNRNAAPLATSPEVVGVKRLAATLERLRGHAPQFYSEHYSTDARFYGAAGMAAVCCGPVGAGLHSPEEWVDIDSLAQLYTVLWQLSLQLD